MYIIQVQEQLEHSTQARKYLRPANALAPLTITVGAGTTSAYTKVTSVVGGLQGWTLKYKVGTGITPTSTFHSSDSGYSALTLNTNISAVSANDIIVVATDLTGIIATSIAVDVVLGS
jgi:hypothetical protein